MATRFVDFSTRGFFSYYWVAFIWMFFPAVFLAVAYAMTKSSGDISALLIYGFFALVRGIWAGWRPSVDGTEDGCLTNVMQTIWLVVLWPIYEFIRQVRFLFSARKAWQGQEVLIRQKSGKPARSA